MRNRKAFKNIIANFSLQFIVMISGIILPRFFLKTYGSSVNGLVSSITQFLSYLNLAEAGVGASSMVALYQPIAEKNTDGINKVVSASRKFYNQSGYIFTVLMSGMILVYPLLINQQLDSSFVRVMIVIIGASNLVDFFFIGKYKVLLTASQNGYIITNIQAVGTVLNVAVSIALINLGFNALIVKGVATAILVMRFFFVRWYAYKLFPELDVKVEPELAALKQKGDVMLHSVVGVIVNNTDIVVLTIMLGAKSLLEVSVYTIYNMVASSITSLLTSFSNAFTSSFGEMLLEDGQEGESIHRAYSDYEFLYFMLLAIICICMGGLILPFISIYTRGINDVNYVRPLVGFLFVLIVFLQNMRIPGLTIVAAAGHFTETRRQAILEATINLVVSLTLVTRFGIVGVLFGTVCSNLYRSTETLIYNSKYLIYHTGKTTFARLFRNVILVGVISFLIQYYFSVNQYNYLSWFLDAIKIGVISIAVVLIVNGLFEKKEMKNLIHRFLQIIKR